MVIGMNRIGGCCELISILFFLNNTQVVLSLVLGETGVSSIVPHQKYPHILYGRSQSTAPAVSFSLPLPQPYLHIVIFVVAGISLYLNLVAFSTLSV